MDPKDRMGRWLQVRGTGVNVCVREGRGRPSRFSKIITRDRVEGKPNVQERLYTVHCDFHDYYRNQFFRVGGYDLFHGEWIHI